jgi:hypothetical protein
VLVRPILVRPELMKPLSQIQLRWSRQHMFGIGSFACVVVYVPLPTAIRVLVVHDDLLSVSDRGGGRLCLVADLAGVCCPLLECVSAAASECSFGGLYKRRRYPSRSVLSSCRSSAIVFGLWPLIRPLRLSQVFSSS